MSGIALCYVRKSVVQKASDEISPERQRSNISREANRRGLDALFFEDAEGHRSGRTEKRAGWQDLKSHLDDPNVKAVIVESLSRASRSIRDLFNFIHELEVRDIALISLKENVDTRTAMGKAFLGVIAVLNQFESDVASDRMKGTIEHVRAERKITWGHTPFGCSRQHQTGKLLPSHEGIWRVGQFAVAGTRDAPPFRAEVRAEWFGYLDALRKCYEIYVENSLGLKELTERLNALGYRYRDRNGGPRPFHKDDIRRMVNLYNLYAGHLPRGRSKDHPTQVSALNAHDPILPRELCEKVGSVVQARHVAWARGGGAPKHVYLLSTAYCGECGSHLRGQFQNGRRRYRHSDERAKVCNQPKYFRADDVEHSAFVHLQCFDAPEDLKARIREKARRLAKQNAKPEWKQARRTLAAIDGQMERLQTLFIDGEIGKTDYQKRKAKLIEQQKEAEHVLAGMPLDVKALEALLGKVDQITAVIRDGDPAQQRAVFTALFERVEVLDSKIVKPTPRDWAKPFFNGHANAQATQA